MKKNKYAYLLILPAVLIVLLTILVPIVTTFRYSLSYFKLTDPNNQKFIGIKNYVDILHDKGFINAFKNSFMILVAVIIIGLVISIVIALILNKKTKISGALLAISIIPWALPPIVNGIIWKFIFFPGYGFANKLIINLGLASKPINWINNKKMFVFLVAMVLCWKIVPFCALVILSKLETIPKTLYEAISIDGAGKFDTFRLITLPLIMEVLGIVLLNLTTAAINVYDEIIALSGYVLENQTLLIYNYANTFQYLNFGYGSAISYTIMIIVGVCGIGYIKRMSRGIK